MLKEQLPPETEDLKPHGGDSKRGDRILIWCFLASILINLGFGLWLNYADIYGEKRQADVNKVMHIRTYKPPIKRKPKPPKPKIIPPKPKIIPKIVHVQPRPQPTPRPHPAPPQHFTVGHHSTSPHAIVTEAPAPPVQEAPVQPVQPENTTVQPTPPAPPPPAPAPPAPKYVPPAPVYHAPPAPKPAPPPPPPKHDKNYLPGVQSREAEISGNPTVDASGIDPPPTSQCVISATIAVDGHIRRVRVKKSSGSTDFDNKCVDAVQRDARGVPAVQDNEKFEASAEYSFDPPSG